MLTRTLVDAFKLELPNGKISTLEDEYSCKLEENGGTFSLLELEPRREITGTAYTLVDQVKLAVMDWGKQYTPSINVLPLVKETIMAPSTEEFDNILATVVDLAPMNYELIKFDISKCVTRVGLDNIASSFTGMLLDMGLHSSVPELEEDFLNIWETWVSDIRVYAMSNFNDCRFGELSLPNLDRNLMLTKSPETINALKRGIFERAKKQVVDSALHELKLTLLGLVKPTVTAIKNSSAQKSTHNLYLLSINTSTRVLRTYDYGDIRIIKYNLSRGVFDGY